LPLALDPLAPIRLFLRGLVLVRGLGVDGREKGRRDRRNRLVYRGDRDEQRGFLLRSLDLLRDFLPRLVRQLRRLPLGPLAALAPAAHRLALRGDLLFAEGQRIRIEHRLRRSLHRAKQIGDRIGAGRLRRQRRHGLALRLAPEADLLPPEGRVLGPHGQFPASRRPAPGGSTSATSRPLRSSSPTSWSGRVVAASATSWLIISPRTRSASACSIVCMPRARPVCITE